MGLLALLNHAINFMAPALWLALLMPLLSRILIRKRPVALTLLAQVAVLFVAGCGLLTAGLVLFGRDGKMLTYLAMVLGIATTQWWLQRSAHA